VTTEDSKREDALEHARSPIMQGVLMLGIYVGMYLAVAGAIHVVDSLDDAIAAASTLPVAEREAPAADPHPDASVRSDGGNRFRRNSAANTNCNCD